LPRKNKLPLNQSLIETEEQSHHWCHVRCATKAVRASHTGSRKACARISESFTQAKIYLAYLMSWFSSYDSLTATPR
jgi:hypothetical protein